MNYAVDGIPAVQLALMYRCFAQGPGGLKSGTLMNDELAEEMGWNADEPSLTLEGAGA